MRVTTDTAKAVGANWLFKLLFKRIRIVPGYALFIARLCFRDYRPAGLKPFLSRNLIGSQRNSGPVVSKQIRETLTVFLFASEIPSKPI